MVWTSTMKVIDIVGTKVKAELNSIADSAAFIAGTAEQWLISECSYSFGSR